MSEEMSLPIVDEERISCIFSELEEMEVHLDSDPLVYGPRRFNGKVATVRKMLSRCERVFLQISHDLQIYKTAHRSAELDFNLQMQDLIANDPEVRAGSNVRDRDAIATMKLRKERQKLIEMEVYIGDLDMVMSVIKSKRADLRDIQGRIRDQVKICQEEIGLGNNWGSHPAPNEKTPDIDNAPQMDQKALESIQSLIQEAGGSEVDEVHINEGDGDWVEGSKGEADVDEFLSAVTEDDPKDDPKEDSKEDSDGMESILDREGVDSIPIPPVDSDEEVDEIFSKIDSTLPPTNRSKKKAAPVDDDLDLDGLIDLLQG